MHVWLVDPVTKTAYMGREYMIQGAQVHNTSYILYGHYETYREDTDIRIIPLREGASGEKENQHKQQDKVKGCMVIISMLSFVESELYSVACFLLCKNKCGKSKAWMFSATL